MIPEQFIQMAHAYRLLSTLDPSQLRKLVPLAEEKDFRSGDRIFHQGDQSAFLHLIVEGDVALEATSSDGGVTVQTLHLGDAMGWSALTRDHRAHFQARALTPVSTVAFASRRIRDACDKDPEMGYAFLKQLLELVTDRLDATRKQLLRREAGAATKTG